MWPPGGITAHSNLTPLARELGLWMPARMISCNRTASRKARNRSLAAGLVVLWACGLASAAAAQDQRAEKPVGAPVEFQVGPGNDPNQLAIAKSWVKEAGCALTVKSSRFPNRIRVVTNGHHSLFKSDPLAAGAWAVDACTYDRR